MAVSLTNFLMMITYKPSQKNYPDISIQSFLLDGSIHSYTLWIPHYNLRRVPESNASKVQPLSSPPVAMIELALSWYGHRIGHVIISILAGSPLP